MPSDYRLSKPLVARMLGALTAAGGAVVVLATLATGLLDLPAWLLPASALAAVVALAAGLWALSRNVTVVRLDEAGYRVRLIRGAGVGQARWTDVEDVVATTAGGERCVVLRLRDGRTTTVPVRLLSGSPDAFIEDLQAHLDTGHGHRRIT